MCLPPGLPPGEYARGELAALGLPDLGNLPTRSRRAYLGLPKVVFTAAGTRLKMQCSGQPAGALGWEDASMVPGVRVVGPKSSPRSGESKV